MARFTKADLERDVQQIRELTGRNLHLDHAACYGGYTLVEIGERGVEIDFLPAGHGRLSAKEMHVALRAFFVGWSEHTIKAGKE